MKWGTEQISVAKAREPVLDPLTAVRRLAGFFALLVALAFVTNVVIAHGLKQIRTSSFGAWNQVMQGKVNADVIITGSSRATYHYDPRVIQGVTGHTTFNLGRVGSQTDVQVAVLKAYLEHNKKPQLIVHNLDAFSLVTTSKVYEPAQYVPYLDDPELYQSMRQIDPEVIKSRYIPLYGYVVEDMNFTWILGVKALFGYSPKQNYFQGFFPRDKEWTDEFEKFKAGNPRGMSFAVEPEGIEALQELIQLCQRGGIRLIFVYSPEYSEMQSLTINRAEIFTRLRELAVANEVPLLDYSAWKYNGDREYFYNSQHLNAAGAALFSDDVAKRLKTYLASQSTTSEASPQQAESK